MIYCMLNSHLMYLGLTKYEIHKKAGVRIQTIYSLCNDENRYISFDVTDKLCKALGCHPGSLYVYLRDGEMPKIDFKYYDFDEYTLRFALGDYLKNRGDKYRFSKATGIRALTISNFCKNNTTGVSRKVLSKICKVLDRDVYDLFRYEK